MNAYRWEDMRVGLRASFDVTLTEQMVKSFTALSGDENPLHVDADYAKGAGFPGPVVYGLLTSAFYSRLVGMYLPGRHALLHGIDVDFVSPAFVGDALQVSGEVTYLTDAYHRIELRGRITRPDGKDGKTGKVISKAKIRVGLHAP